MVAMPCSAAVKEVLWLMAVDSVPGSRFRPFRCPCCAPLPTASVGRRHTFWDCPVAQAVRVTLSTELGAPTPDAASLWLPVPPSPHVPLPLWRLVALCALTAMDHGRCHLWTARYERPGARPDVQASCRAAVGSFWLLLEDFVGAHPHPLDGWDLDGDTPFVALDDGALSVRLPA